MNLEEMRLKKKELGLSNQKLSELSGVSLGTLAKIMSGATENPRFETLAALEGALRKAAAGRGRISPDGKMPNDAAQSGYSVSENKDNSLLRERPLPYGDPDSKHWHGYTLEDYLNLPDDGPRMELIDGQFYDMGEPSTAHQLIIGFVYKKLLDHVFEKKGPCLPVLSPVAVQLDRDDKTVVEPDIAIICHRELFVNRRIFGAPYFILEVLSPSTRKKDMSLKLYKYQNAGVREYWMIDPRAQKIMVHDFENDDLPKIYSFQDKVAVKIWNEECVIDFNEMTDFMGFTLSQ